VIPSKDEFPYTMLLTSEVLESNGSTSMGATCGSTLALMDAGVPIKAPVSGIAMGLMTEGEKFVVLSDIQGMEDFSGDMDFKVAGTANGITAIQLDTKIRGLTPEMIKATFMQAKSGRAHILGEMLKAIPEVRSEMSKHAPRIFSLQINPEKIGAVIGPGGKMIKQIEAESGAQVSIEQDGTIYIAAKSGEGGEIAANMIRGITSEIEVGTRFKGKVTRLMGMGAFVEFMPGKEGLVHTSLLSEEPIRRPDDAVKVGDEIDVRVVEVDPQGRINLSAIKLDEPYDPALHRAQREDRGPRGGGFRGGDRDRGGFRGGDRDRGGDRGGDRRFGRDPDRGFRGAPAHTSEGSERPQPRDDAPAPEKEEEVPKARFRPRR
jgi:polyribonucleotide nucleotidyltransferase